MAKIEQVITGDFDKLLNRIEEGILRGSISATLEDKSDIKNGNVRCSVRVFERYSAWGKNRVSLNVVLFQNGKDEKIYLSAITSGGGTGIFFKILPLGEETFLDKLKEII